MGRKEQSLRTKMGRKPTITCVGCILQSVMEWMGKVPIVHTIMTDIVLRKWTFIEARTNDVISI